MTRYIYLFLIVAFITSCKTISIAQDYQKTTTQNIQLGTVGEQKNFVLEQDYNHTALPKYQTPIKVNVSVLDFNKTIHKAFANAKENQNQAITVNYVDSLKRKPKYLKLEIADRVAVLNALNSKENKDVFSFLETKTEAHLISSIALALNPNDLIAITAADEVFLEVTGIKNYALKLYKNKLVQQTIMFNDGVVFAYKTSSCCWKQNDKYQLEIVDLVQGRDKCPSDTYRFAKRAKKKIDYYKL
ncbi:hypothetical protein [Lacinutrix sp.]|uniref:hypothetical protein n=1 Tax=Lacinutrix sp. TaxID=1937692 RepID=UPI0025C56223|nr:hypothetical protein [Lacinutrix sp.]